MVYGAASVALSESFRQDWWVSALLLSMAIFCASQWPAELGVSKSGIYDKKWLGLQKKTFAWTRLRAQRWIHQKTGCGSCRLP